MQMSGGSQSFNAVNSLRLLGRWMRMFTISNQSSVTMAYKEFDEDGRMRPHAAQLVNRYSECKEAGIPVDASEDISAIAIAPER